MLRDRRVLTLGGGLFLVAALGLRLTEFLTFKDGEPWGFDFSSYWYAGKAVLEGRSIYWDLQLEGQYVPQGRHLYTYPPFLAVAAAPLAAGFATFREAQAVWASLEALTLLAALTAIVMAHKGADGGAMVIVAALALAFPPVVSELLNGNVHLFLLGLYVIAWLGLREKNAVGESIAGAAVGIAALVKIFPAVVIVWFLLTGRRRAAVAAVVAPLFLAASTLPLVGTDPWFDYPTVLLNLGRSTDTTDTLSPTAWLSQVVDFTAARISVSALGFALLAWTAARLPTALSFAVAVWISVLIAPAVYHHYLALALLPLAFGLFHGASRPWLLVSYVAMFGGEQPLLGDLDWLTNRAMPSIGALLLLVALFRGRSVLRTQELAEGTGGERAKPLSVGTVAVSHPLDESVAAAGTPDRIP